MWHPIIMRYYEIKWEILDFVASYGILFSDKPSWKADSWSCWPGFVNVEATKPGGLACQPLDFSHRVCSRSAALHDRHQVMKYLNSTPLQGFQGTSMCHSTAWCDWLPDKIRMTHGSAHVPHQFPVRQAPEHFKGRELLHPGAWCIGISGWQGVEYALHALGWQVMTLWSRSFDKRMFGSQLDGHHICIPEMIRNGNVHVYTII
jgi:hypothetical protein